MSVIIPLASVQSIREAGYNEAWLQDMIWQNPACLGFGDLEALQKERNQPTGGRIDMLLKDPSNDTMYEVEIMLGATDETHIIRTIEYWDNEKRRWPTRHHIAVLVAEDINRRFFNVIHILSHSIPIVAVQVSLIHLDGKVGLHFAKILDTFQEVDDGSGSEVGQYNLNWWVANLPDTVSFATYFENLAAKNGMKFEKDGVKNYISLSNENRNFAWIRPRKNKTALIEFRVNDLVWEELEQKLQSIGISPIRKTSSFVFNMASKDATAANEQAFAEVMSLLKDI
ncbi:hypothetical protein [Rhizobium bangladeshense]|uniref:hypothetical protein n=1 Tax=Rhizobium bangladeshense TaxID=1138189 RepID=UPI001C83748C|nr:hypothetical protein [Rhizobium bangladeshense]MBX4916724.1 hypothetical protein [Rhizobium bangladeshense]